MTAALCGGFTFSALCRVLCCCAARVLYRVLCCGVVPAAATANGNYLLAYALLVSGASTGDATDALQSLICGFKAAEDQRSALTNALLLAHGAQGARKKLDEGFIGAWDWQGGKCVMPAAGRNTEATCECVSCC